MASLTAPRAPARSRTDLQRHVRRAREASVARAGRDARELKPIVQTDSSSRVSAPTVPALTPLQSAAFKCGLLLGAPLALYKIALDVRNQNIAERKRALAASDKTRMSSALEARRNGRLRANAVGDSAKRAEVRRKTNVTDIPIASNVKREVKLPKRGARDAAAKPRRAERATAAVGDGVGSVARKNGPKVKMTLATQCKLPEGVTLSVVGSDAKMKKPLAMQRVGRDRWQIVVELNAGDLRYMYVASEGKKVIKEGSGERRLKIEVDGETLVIDKNEPVFAPAVFSN